MRSATLACIELKVARVTDLNDPFELMAVNFRNKHTRVVVEKWRLEYGEKNGLLSFSSDWMNPVLWSHYGDKHRGMCLGLNLHLADATPVKYEAERLSDDLDHSAPATITPRIAERLLATKFRHWQYEDEWRRFVPLHEAMRAGSLYFLPFGPTLELAEVILGQRCTFDVSVVRNLTKRHYKAVNVIKARLEHKGFHIVPDEYSW